MKRTEHLFKESDELIDKTKDGTYNPAQSNAIVRGIEGEIKILMGLLKAAQLTGDHSKIRENGLV